MSDGSPTRPNNDTRATEREDAQQHADADRQPTPEEEKIAEQRRSDPNVSQSYEEAIERGADQKGEGRID